MKRYVGGLLFTLLLLIGTAALAEEKIYYFQTANGEIYFTDTPETGFVEYGDIKVNQREAEVIEAAIRDYAERSRLDPLLIRAIIKAESNFRPTAVSAKGAQGLMQIMPLTAKHLGLANPFDPAQNIRAGAKYLRQLLDTFGDVKLALAAYNAGPQKVKDYKGMPPFAETIRYVESVLLYYQQMKSYT